MNTFQHLFRQNDLTRALRAAAAAGVEVERVEVDPISGRITVIPRAPYRLEGDSAKGNNPWGKAV